MPEDHDLGPGDIDVDSWIRSVLQGRYRGRRIVHERIEDDSARPNRLIVNVGGDQIELGQTPPGWEVELTCQREEAHPKEMVVAASVPPERLIVSAWPSLATVNLQLDPTNSNGWAGALEFGLIASGDLTLNLGQIVVPHLAVHAGSLTVKSKAQPLRVELDSASIEGVKRISGELVLKGSVHLPSGLRSAKTLLDDGETTIQAIEPKRRVGAPDKEPPPIRLGSLQGAESAPVRLRVEARVIAESVPAASTVDIAKGALFQTTGTVDNLEVRGEGTVHIARGSRIAFHGEGNLDLVLESGNSIEDASGKVGTLTIRDATITGAGDTPLAPLRIEEAEGAELDGVDLTELESIASIQSLQSAHRVVPAISSEPDKLTVVARDRPPGMTVEARQVFWAQLSDLVAEKKARGAVQSDLRFVSAHARLMAAPTRTRESAWLWLYKLVGYGERISRPLLIHLVASTLVFALIVFGVGGLEPTPGASVDLRLLWDLLVLPLSFFRLTGDSVISGGWLADALTLFLRVGGILMIFFSLAAVRRLTKAE